MWAADLLTRVPGASIRSRIDLIAALAAAGRFDGAADEAERLAEGLEDGDAAGTPRSRLPVPSVSELNPAGGSASGPPASGAAEQTAMGTSADEARGRSSD